MPQISKLEFINNNWTALSELDQLIYFENKCCARDLFEEQKTQRNWSKFIFDLQSRNAQTVSIARTHNKLVLWTERHQIQYYTERITFEFQCFKPSPASESTPTNKYTFVYTMRNENDCEWYEVAMNTNSAVQQQNMRISFNANQSYSIHRMVFTQIRIWMNCDSFCSDKFIQNLFWATFKWYGMNGTRVSVSFHSNILEFHSFLGWMEKMIRWWIILSENREYSPFENSKIGNVWKWFSLNLEGSNGIQLKCVFEKCIWRARR